MSSPSPSAPPAKRAKPAPAAVTSWQLHPVKKDANGPIEGPAKELPRKIHEDFTELGMMLDLLAASTGDSFFFDTPDEEFLKEHYMESMEGKRLVYAKILLSTIVDFLYKYVFRKGGGVLKTRVWYVPQSTYVTIRSSFLEEWMPVLEEDEEYGALTYGNFTAFILALAFVMGSDNPRKALGLRELP